MPVVGKLTLTNTGAFAADLGCGWIDANGVEHPPINGSLNGTFDPGQFGVTAGSTVWAYVHVDGASHRQGSAQDGGGLIFQPGDPHEGHYKISGTTFDTHFKFEGVEPPE